VLLGVVCMELREQHVRRHSRTAARFGAQHSHATARRGTQQAHRRMTNSGIPSTKPVWAPSGGSLLHRLHTLSYPRAKPNEHSRHIQLVGSEFSAHRLPGKPQRLDRALDERRQGARRLSLMPRWASQADVLGCQYPFRDWRRQGGPRAVRAGGARSAHLTAVVNHRVRGQRHAFRARHGDALADALLNATVTPKLTAPVTRRSVATTWHTNCVELRYTEPPSLIGPQEAVPLLPPAKVMEMLDQTAAKVAARHDEHCRRRGEGQAHFGAGRSGPRRRRSSPHAAAGLPTAGCSSGRVGQKAGVRWLLQTP